MPLHAALRRIEDKLTLVLCHVQQLLLEAKILSAELDRLKASVEAEKAVVASVVTLLGRLTQMIRDAGTDPTALKALADEVDAQKKALADAVTANTPSAAPGG